jgi:hypothetical protein
MSSFQDRGVAPIILERIMAVKHYSEMTCHPNDIKQSLYLISVKAVAMGRRTLKPAGE